MTKDESDLLALGKSYSARGYVVVGSEEALSIGEIVWPPWYGNRDIGPPLRIVAETDEADMHEHARLAGFPAVERYQWKYYYRAEGD